MVSVVVPAYNVESYVGEAVASVMAQTVKDWELILVDDGSTDRTAEICDAMAQADSRIHVVHTPNGGLSVARNRGLALCKGEWITFLDADDLLHPRFLEIMLKAAADTDAEIVDGEAMCFRGPRCAFPGLDASIDTETYASAEALEKGLYQRNGILTAAWCKIYARGLWDNVAFTPGILYEDLDVVCRLWPKARRLAHVPAPLYGYRQRGGSILNTFSLRRADVLAITAQIEDYALAEAPGLLGAARDRRLSANFNMFLTVELARRAGQCGAEEAARLQQHCWTQIKRLRAASVRNPKVRLKNRIGAFLSWLGPGFIRRLAPLTAPPSL